MEIDREKLMQTATKALRRLDVVATPAAAVAAILMIFALDVQPLLAIALSIGVYVGVTLIRPETKPPVVAVLQPISPELQALEAARDASARITASIPGIQKASLRKRVTSIVTQIDKMLDVIEEDGKEKVEKLAAAPLYESRLVRLFETTLRDDLRLRVRGVEMADSSHIHFETVVLPRFETAAKEFYQRYHQSDVIDLAALLEILMYNLDSIGEVSMDGVDTNGRTTNGGNS